MMSLPPCFRPESNWAAVLRRDSGESITGSLLTVPDLGVEPSMPEGGAFTER
jgi:hypothetical protein